MGAVVIVKKVLILFILLLCIGEVACHNCVPKKNLPFTIEIETKKLPPHRNGPLTKWEYDAAKKAWGYFERVTVPETGLPEGAVGSPTISMWDVAGYIAALVSAKRLKIIDKVKFNRRMTRLVYWLNTMELTKVGLPNKFYSAKTGKMINAMGKPGMAGFSAIDIGRLLIWLRIVRNEFIAHAEAVDRAVLRWNFRNILDSEGLLYGGYLKKNGTFQYYREGRLGLRQYAAKGFALWGFNTEAASKYDNISYVYIYGELLPFDSRPPGIPPQFGAITTRLAVLDGLEFGWRIPDPVMPLSKWKKDPSAFELARRIYLVQEARFNKKGILTARDSHNLDRPPYYVIDAVYVNGKPFHTMTATGEPRPNDSCVSVSAAFSLWSLFKSHFTDVLIKTLKEVYDKNGGWYVGTYEQDGAINRAISLRDNALILEALLFKAKGPLYKGPLRRGYWEKTLSRKEFREKGLPPSIFQKEYRPLMPNLKGVPKVK